MILLAGPGELASVMAALPDCADDVSTVNTFKHKTESPKISMPSILCKLKLKFSPDFVEVQLTTRQIYDLFKKGRPFAKICCLPGNQLPHLCPVCGLIQARIMMNDLELRTQCLGRRVRGIMARGIPADYFKRLRR